MTGSALIPDPWTVLRDELPDVVLLRERIPEPGRYYDAHRAIVLRKGLSLEQERRYLWHELVHASRGDSVCDGLLRAKMERSVERQAARRAMPLESMCEGLACAAAWPDFVWLMKVPESWVRLRIDIAHPAERAALVKACRWVTAA